MQLPHDLWQYCCCCCRRLELPFRLLQEIAAGWNARKLSLLLPTALLLPQLIDEPPMQGYCLAAAAAGMAAGTTLLLPALLLLLLVVL